MKTYFPIVLSGFDKGGMAAYKGRRVVSLTWPKLITIGLPELVQTMDGLWGLRLCWENGDIWRFENVPEDVKMEDGFEFEIGTLLITKTNFTSNSEKIIHSVDHFVVDEIKIANGCDDDNFTDCAIALIGTRGRELMVLTAVPPTTVTFGISDGPYPNPEFPLTMLKWRDIDEEFVPPKPDPSKLKD